MRVSHWPYTYQFKRPAGTSRGTLTVKEAYFLEIQGTHNGVSFSGRGECGLLRGLSSDDVPQYEGQVESVVNLLRSWTEEEWESVWSASGSVPDALYLSLQPWPSLQFALEQTFKSAFENRLGRPLGYFFDSDFSQQKGTIPINGLIWMGSSRAMSEEIVEKVGQGYSCIKLKIGAMNWQAEQELVSALRAQYPSSLLEIRVDANGGFSEEETRVVLPALATMGVHSIEQPLPATRREGLARLAAERRVDIALDESLIGLHTAEERNALLDEVKPQWIVIKPSFVGGWRGTEDWIARAESRGIGWWVTSALEGNWGLNAIAQWCGHHGTRGIAQGLGTGTLYSNNFPALTQVKKGQLISLLSPLEGSWMYKTYEWSDPSLVQEVHSFLRQWFDASLSLCFTTSGTTGEPKVIHLSKSAMAASARMTIAALDLKPGTRALLSLSPTKIGGAMVLVRALVGGWIVDIGTVERNPLRSIPPTEGPWDFASWVPQQCVEKSPMKRIKTLLLGGSEVSPEELYCATTVAGHVTIGFGMTETVSHIALCRLYPQPQKTKEGEWTYTPLEGVQVQVAPEGELRVQAPHLGIPGWLITSDVVEWQSIGAFTFKGRSDHAINSAGIKIFPEAVEGWVRAALPNGFPRGVATWVSDVQWNQKLVWLSEFLTEKEKSTLEACFRKGKQLNPYAVPKAIFIVSVLPKTKNGKILRTQAHQIAQELALA